ncbi:MAG TPA: 5-(carboxyamino)imidazole ribonucleotide synthase [Burkholderiaceae bacterium]|nr:5-(carboxyamino)imidazole ribonucleotide synthase [Burkholderiaceae bacterium]
MSSLLSAPIAPGAWLGLLGGGQLGRMFCMAAQSLGYKVCVLDPGVDSPAGAVADDHLCADYLDSQALDELARRCSAATTEFENVPAAALEFLAQRCRVSPDAASVAIAQDRIAEKRFLAASGIEVAPHAVIASTADLERLDAALLPGILKSARLGYDGKGQARVATVQEARAAFASMGAVPCVLEQRLALELELSVVVTRSRSGAVSTFPVAENQHRSGILAVSIVPARIDATLLRQAQQAAIAVASALNYVGVLCVEFFVVGGHLLANEIAPRPHNSGHYTIDACVSSQFDQQARVMAGQPLGDAGLLAPAVMLNVLGDVWFDQGRMREPPWHEVLAVPGAKLHLYGKSEARVGRKMGHVTCIAATVPDALARARDVARVLGIAQPD